LAVWDDTTTDLYLTQVYVCGCDIEGWSTKVTKASTVETAPWLSWMT